jgi:hypothetical protein
MQPFSRDQVDPSVTDDEITQAIEGTPAPYTGADVDEQDELDTDVLRSLLAIVPADVPTRCTNAKRLRDDHVHLGVNRCLAVVRGPILGLPPLYPTAADAGDHSKPFHPITDPASLAVPHGAIGFAWNGGAGHTWLELGPVTIGGKRDAIVSTTDFHEPGYEGIALRSRMLTWCRATRWGWGQSVNGYAVGPDPRSKPKPKPKPLPIPARIKLLAAHEKELRKAGHAHRADRVHLWEQQLQRKAGK